MKAHLIVRRVILVSAFAVLAAAILCPSAAAQSVGGDIGGGIFRPKNPEIKKRTTRPKPIVKPSRRTPVTVDVDDRVDELLDKGNGARDAKKYSEAQADYEGALKLKPRDARGAYGLGNVYTDQRRWDDAEKAYRDAVEWSPSNDDALVALSVVLVQPQAGANNAKRFADAQAFAQRAAQIAPKNAVAWDRLGIAMQARGLLNSETEHAYRRAVELDPNFAAAYAHLARLLRKMERSDEAAPLYDHAIELAKDSGTLVLIAESLQSEQQWDKSEAVLRRALEADARSPSVLYLLGRVLIVLKHPQEAEGYLKSATELSPQAFQPYVLLGQAYLALLRFDEAEKAYNSAAEVGSPAEQKQLSGVFGFEGVGDGYAKAKKRSDAARAYQRALDLDPGNEHLRKKLSQVH